MNLDELQSIQSRERQATSLQNLRPTFYKDAGEFIQELVRERDRAAERATDPFSSDEVRRLTDNIETAKSTVEAIYERRVGKVVKTASIAAAGMPADEDGLTEEEERLFGTLVERIETNREHVLDDVLEDGGSGISCSRDATPSEASAEPSATNSKPESEVRNAIESDSAPAAELGLDPTPNSPRKQSNDGDGVSAAEMMGDGTDADTTVPDSVPAEMGQSDTAVPDEQDTASDDQNDSVERTTVRITSDVGEVFGIDERSYNLSSDDVVTLPAENAGPLVERDAAERLD
ncbi:hypothetical protein BRD04_04985 [Halobacteriales archaeon QS_9_67_17]|nr:MAG: hypothetical protein BRD04_04985 [Halobacteriales archaeon QS_9_67_17]